MCSVDMNSVPTSWNTFRLKGKFENLAEKLIRKNMKFNMSHGREQDPENYVSFIGVHDQN